MSNKLIVGGVIAGGLMLGAAGLVLGAGLAKADTQEQKDASYVSCVAQDGLHSTNGPSVMSDHGRMIALDLIMGVRSPTQEVTYVYLNTPASITRSDATVLVACAQRVYITPSASPAGFAERGGNHGHH